MCRKLLAYFSVTIFCIGVLLAANLPNAHASLQAKGEWVFPPYTKEGGLPSNYVYSIKADKNGDIWCCSAEGSDQKPKGGISKYIGSLGDRNPPEWATYDMANGLPDKRVYSFDFDNVGNIWVATQKGVCKINPAGELLYTPKELEDSPTKNITISRTGEVWVVKTASPESGPALYRYNGVEWTRYDAQSAPYPNGLLDYTINCIEAGPQSDIWIGTASGGATRFDPATNTWTHYTPANSGLPHSAVKSILFDGGDSIWFGTARTGSSAEEAAKLNIASNSWVKYNVGNSDVASISVSHQGVWFGTRTEGVYLYNQNQPPDKQWILFSTTSTEDGLPNEHVRGIVYDNSGYIWFATLSGGIGRLLAISVTELVSQRPGASPGTPGADETIEGAGISEAGSEAQAQEQQEINDTIKKLARTGLNFLPYLIPGLFLLLIGLGSGSRSTVR